MNTSLTTLNNGLKVVSDNITSVETVSLGIWVNVGNRNETAQTNGISHFLEHMAFKGTKRRTALQIVQEIEDVGGYLNAYTSKETTAYYARVLKQHVPLALDILTDILQFSIFEPEELEKERSVILQEIGQTFDTPDDIIFDHFQAHAFPNQPLGRPILGTTETVNSFSAQDLQNYMDHHYQPRRMVVAAAGNLDHDCLVQQVNDLLGTYKLESSFAKTALEPGSYRGGTFTENRSLEQVHLVLGFQGLPYTQTDFYKANVLSMILGGGMSSRLFQEIREKRGLVYSIFSSHSAYKDTGLFSIYAGTNPDRVTELLPAVFAQMEDVAKHATVAELNRSKAQLKAHLMMAMESMSSRCEQLANQVLNYGAPLSAEALLHRIDIVTIEDIKNFSQQLLKTPLTIALMGNLTPLNDSKILETLSTSLQS